jgi:AraC family transcriptional regulator
MVIREIPSNPGLGKNYVLHLKTRKLNIPEQITPLTVKFSLYGIVKYRTPNGEYNVNVNYLIVNEGQKCSCSVNSSQPVELISIFFEKNFASEVLGNLTAPEDKLIFNPSIKNSQPIQFFEKLYPIDNFVMPVIMKMKIASGVGFEDEEWWEEQFYELLEKMVLVHRNVYKQVEKLPPVKFSTKTDLYKRISRAKEFIDINYTQPLTLEKISNEAFLSRFHFLRLFKEVFGETPYQYISTRRIRMAVMLLTSSSMPVTEICSEVGFDSLSSFSWLFKQKLGLSPDAFRSAFRKADAKISNI